MALTPQTVLFVASIVSFVAAIVCALIAVRVYVRLDIRSVRDDLAGRQHRGGARVSTRGVRRGAAYRRDWVDARDNNVSAEYERKPDGEDAVATMIDLPKASSRKVSISEADREADTPTLVDTSEEELTSTIVADEEYEFAASAPVGDAVVPIVSAGKAPLEFEIVKREILWHSDEIIAAG